MSKLVKHGLVLVVIIGLIVGGFWMMRSYTSYEECIKVMVSEFSINEQKAETICQETLSTPALLLKVYQLLK
ncbi:hypothetical protein AGMMS50249_3730 [candidate division SR1 bacterium]|nr:hypothetical protein AGMMS50249_3730 [candidate division SR1 bacterium]